MKNLFHAHGFNLKNWGAYSSRKQLAWFKFLGTWILHDVYLVSVDMRKRFSILSELLTIKFLLKFYSEKLVIVISWREIRNFNFITPSFLCMHLSFPLFISFFWWISSWILTMLCDTSLWSSHFVFSSPLCNVARIRDQLVKVQLRQLRLQR